VQRTLHKVSGPLPRDVRRQEKNWSNDEKRMRHFGTIVFGLLTVLSTLAVLWLSHGAGTKDGHATVFGLAVSPILFLVFVGPFAVLFLIGPIRGTKH